MSLVAHIQTLEEKHENLEKLIARESMRPMPDFVYITSLKKQKLLIKEELARLARDVSDKRASAS